MSYENILFSVDGGVARLTLNRPDRLNSFNDAMHAEVRDALGRVAADASARVLLLTGAGRGFCAGQDLSDRAVAPGGEAVDLGASILPHGRGAAAGRAALRGGDVRHARGHPRRRILRAGGDGPRHGAARGGRARAAAGIRPRGRVRGGLGAPRRHHRRRRGPRRGLLRHREVKNAGAYPCDRETDVLKAVTLAGGFTDAAAKGKIRIVRRVGGQEQVRERVGLEEPVLANDVLVVPKSFF